RAFQLGNDLAQRLPFRIRETHNILLRHDTTLHGWSPSCRFSQLAATLIPRFDEALGQKMRAEDGLAASEGLSFGDAEGGMPRTSADPAMAPRFVCVSPTNLSS